MIKKKIRKEKNQGIKKERKKGRTVQDEMVEHG